MPKAIFDGELRILRLLRPIHWLQKEMAEIEIGKLLRIHATLREDKLELVALPLYQLRPNLGTDADPVQSLWSSNRSVGLDSNLEIASMQSINKRLVHLQQRLATRANNKPLSEVLRPLRSNRIGKRIRRVELAATWSIDTDKIRIAEFADGRSSILLSSRPEIAAGKAAKDRRPAGMRTLAL